jgi:hypothetical protein
LPDVFDRIELGRLGRQEHERDGFGYIELGGDVPSGLVENENVSAEAWPFSLPCNSKA